MIAPPHLMQALIGTNERYMTGVRRGGLAPRQGARHGGAGTVERETDSVVIRGACGDDVSALSALGRLCGGVRRAERLAALATASAGTLLVGETNGHVVAALDLEEGKALANPLRRSGAARELLELRGRQLRGETAGRPSWWWRLGRGFRSTSAAH